MLHVHNFLQNIRKSHLSLLKESPLYAYVCVHVCVEGWIASGNEEDTKTPLRHTSIFY